MTKRTNHRRHIDYMKRMTHMYINATVPLNYEFHPHNTDFPFTVNGKEYRSLTHYIQSCKYGDTSWAELVRTSETVKEARYLGKTRLYPLDSNWASNYEQIIRDGIKARFDQHPFLKNRLMKCYASQICVQYAHKEYSDRHTPYEQNIIGRLMLDVLSEFRQTRTRTQRVGT